MDLCLAAGSRPLELPLIRPKCDTLVVLHRKLNTKQTFHVRTTHLTITAKKRRTVIEGVSDEMNAIASQNLDLAPARRRVRSAFTEVQQKLDHCLFKMAPSGIREEE
ncbi:acylglycerol lipase, partial [Sarracenia purpurea var. burkii]